MTTEAELLAARLARIKGILADLERECATGVDAHETFRKLKAELDAARESLKILDTHPIDDGSGV